jgi:hypothetical protein
MLEGEPDLQERAALSLEPDPLGNAQEEVRALRKPERKTVLELLDGGLCLRELRDERRVTGAPGGTERVAPADERCLRHARTSRSGRDRAA